jgi:hypothetical protein
MERCVYAPQPIRANWKALLKQWFFKPILVTTKPKDMNRKITGDEPAMPIVVKVGDGTGSRDWLTIRQYYAGLAMQSLIATRTVLSFRQKVRVFFGCAVKDNATLLRFHPDSVAKLAVEQADALITTLSKEG